MTKARKPSVVMRFCEYELEDLDHLAFGYSRSTIVNIALEYFLCSAEESHFYLSRKRRVNLIIRRNMMKKLTEFAQSSGVNRTDLIRLAIRNFKLKYGPQHTARHYSDQA